MADDIAQWLEGLGLSQYAQVFEDNAVSLEVLPHLTEDDLKELGLALGHRRILQAAIKKHTEEPLSTSVKPHSTSNQTSTQEAERRHLTVLFCDLARSTELSSRLDPEDMREVLRAYQAACSGVIDRYEGFIAKFMGDGIYVYFGYPTAHEDDAERAISAGLGIIEEMSAMDIPQQAGLNLAVRIGVATGDVAVGDLIGKGASEEANVVGEAPNLAARMQAIAEPNSIVIGAETHDLVQGLFETKALGEQDLKGFMDPVATWRVLKGRPNDSRFQATRGTYLTDLVGRDEELEILLRRWQRAKQGEGQVVLISGEPGIGKSRLAEALQDEIIKVPHTCLRYQCSPYHTNSALYPVIEQFGRAAGFEVGDSPDIKLDKLEAALAKSGRPIDDVAPLIASLLSIRTDDRYPALNVSPQRQKELTLNALVDQLVGLSEQQPVLFAFEDAHWIDPTTRELLEMTVERVPDVAVLMLITHRPEFDSSWIGRPRVTPIILNRLERQDCAIMVENVAKEFGIAEELRDRIATQTDGVPLFIEELTKSVLERAADAGAAFDVPTTLKDSLEARLDRLGPAKEVAEVAAVIGRTFDYDLLSRVSDMDDAALNSALEMLVSSGLATVRGRPPDATYTFKHALVQDAAYESLLRTRRRAIHASIFAALEAGHRGDPSEVVELLAHHSQRGELWDKAVTYLRQAGAKAAARSALIDARVWLEQALDVIETAPKDTATLEQAFEIRLELRSVLTQLGELQQARERLLEADDIAVQLKDDPRRGRVSAALMTIQTLLADYDEAVVTGARALEIAERLGDLRLRIPTASYLEQAHYYRAEYERVVELATDALAILPADWSDENFGMIAPVTVYARSWLVMSLAELGQFGEALEHASEASRLAEATQHAYTIGLADRAAGTLYVLMGEWVKARLVLEHGIQVLRAANVALSLTPTLASSAWALAQLGETGEALSRLQERELTERHFAARGRLQLRGWDYHAMGRAYLLLDQLDDARRLADRASEFLQSQPGAAAHALHLLGDIATHPDRFDAETGNACYRKALALAESHGMRPLIAHCYFGLSRLYRRKGDRKQAHEHLISAATMYHEMEMTFWREQAEIEGLCEDGLPN